VRVDTLCDVLCKIVHYESTHKNILFNSHMPGQPGLASCPFEFYFQFPVVVILSILTEMPTLCTHMTLHGVVYPTHLH